MAYMASLGEKIELARIRLGKDQKDLAETLGVSKATVSRWESGKTEPRPWRLALIAKELDRPIEWFKGGAINDNEILRRLEALEGKLPAKSAPAPSASIDGVVAQIEALFDGGKLSLRKRALILALLKSDPSYLEGLDESQSRLARALLKAL